MVAQQFRWFTWYAFALGELCHCNTGLCQKMGHSFGELIEHFILGADEMSMCVNANRVLKIVGECSRKNMRRTFPIPMFLLQYMGPTLAVSVMV